MEEEKIKEKEPVSSPVRYWFTADTHFGHINIIRYTNRPFKTVEEMDDALIKNWNQCVTPKDHIYHLGDFCFKEPAWYLRRLQGNIHFVPGNHDKRMKQYREEMKNNSNKYVHFMLPLDEVKIGDQLIILSHYAMKTFRSSHYGAYQLYGHSHGTLPDDPNILSMDVGVDANFYFPISFESVVKHMSKKTFKPVDHHVKRE